MTLLPVPSEWFLVVPAKLTKGEREFVLALENHRTLEKEGITPPAVGIIGITELDDMAIDDPGIYRYLARNRLRDDVEAYRLETETLTGGAQSLHRRLADLGDLADSTDPHWGYDFTRNGNHTTVTVRPLHPSAAQLSPITTSLNLGFSPEHEAVRTQLERSLRFGASGDVVLPVEVIRQVTIDGPELIRGTHNDVEVVLRGLGISAAVGIPVTLQFFDTGGTLQASHEGTVTYADKGTDGYALRAKFYDHLTCEFLTPLEGGQKGSSDISYTLTKILPRDAVGVIELVRLFHVDEAVCKVFVNGDQLMSFSVDPHPEREEDDDLDVIYNCAYDLDIVQRHLHTTFYLPVEFSVEDRINLRIARIMIGGDVAQSIQAPALTWTLSGVDSPGTRKRLNELSVIQAPIDYSFQLGNRTLDLGTATVFHPAARAVNRADAIAALNAGTAANFEVELKPSDTAYFNIFLPELLRDPDHPMLAEWTLPGITQPGIDTE